MNFVKFVRTRCIKETARTLEMHKDLQRAALSNYDENEIKKISGRPRLFARKDQNILISK